MSAPTTPKLLLSGQLVERFLKEFEKRRKYLAKHYRPKAEARYRFTMPGIAKLSGTPLQTVRQHLAIRNRAMDFQAFDKYMYITGIGILDLIYPSEYKSLDAKPLEDQSK